MWALATSKTAADTVYGSFRERVYDRSLAEAVYGSWTAIEQADSEGGLESA